MKSEVPVGHLNGDVKNYCCLCKSGVQGRGLGTEINLQVVNREAEFKAMGLEGCR